MTVGVCELLARHRQGCGYIHLMEVCIDTDFE